MSGCVVAEFFPWSVKTRILHNHSAHVIFGEGIDYESEKRKDI
jgi:hypothetical protein